MNTKTLQQQIKTNEVTRQFKPEIEQAIQKQALLYVDTFALRYIADDICGSKDDFTKPVENRIKNLLADYSDDEITLKTINSVSKNNLSFQPEEERAILEAYKLYHLPEATTYILLFFTHKVQKFLSSRAILNSEYVEDVYNELKYNCLFKICDKFDFDKMKTGGLTTQFCYYEFNDYCKLRFSNLGKYKLTLRQTHELETCKRIFNNMSEEDKKLSLRQLSSKYKVGYKTMILYVDCFFQEEKNTDKEANETSLNKINCIDPNEKYYVDNDFDEAEKPILYSQFFVELNDQFEINKEKALLIMNAVVDFKKTDTSKIPLSTKKKKIICEEINVSLHELDTVLTLFGEYFAA